MVFGLYLAFAVRGGPVGAGVAQQIASLRRRWPPDSGLYSLCCSMTTFIKFEDFLLSLHHRLVVHHVAAFISLVRVLSGPLILTHHIHSNNPIHLSRRHSPWHILCGGPIAVVLPSIWAIVNLLGCYPQCTREYLRMSRFARYPVGKRMENSRDELCHFQLLCMLQLLSRARTSLRRMASTKYSKATMIQMASIRTPIQSVLVFMEGM